MAVDSQGFIVWLREPLAKALPSRIAVSKLTRDEEHEIIWVTIGGEDTAAGHVFAIPLSNVLGWTHVGGLDPALRVPQQGVLPW